MPTRLITALLAPVAAALIIGATVATGSGASAAQLLRGWNNIAYFGHPAPPAQALAALTGEYTAVYRWDPTTQTYQLFAPGVPGFVNTLETIHPGDAIWIHFTGTRREFNTGAPPTGSAPAPTSGRISIAASTFVPSSDLALYEKGFNQLHPLSTDRASQRYYAPVHLPHGATVTSMTAAFEGTGDSVHIRLNFTPITNGDVPGIVYRLAEVLSSAGPSPQTASAFTHQVDNGANVYFVVVDLTAGPASKLRGISISYTY
jgi:hypothetical protein